MPRFMVDSNLYGWDAPEAQLKSVRKACFAFAAAGLVLTLVPGLLRCGVARHNWVGFAATAALVAIMLEIIAVFRFALTKSHLDYRTFHSIHWMMDYAPLFHAILMITALVSGVVSCIQGFTGILDVVAVTLFLLAAVSSLTFRRIYHSVPVYTVKEHEA